MYVSIHQVVALCIVTCVSVLFYALLIKIIKGKNKK